VLLVPSSSDERAEFSGEEDKKKLAGGVVGGLFVFRTKAGMSEGNASADSTVSQRSPLIFQDPCSFMNSMVPICSGS